MFIRRVLVIAASAVLLCCRGTTFPAKAFDPTPTATATATAMPTSSPTSATATDAAALKADCGPTEYEGYADTPIVFDGRGSSTPHGPIRAYQWDFGDGTIGQGVTPTHIYHPVPYPYKIREFTVTLTIVDYERQTASCATTCLVLDYY
jgi:hypothetical protein